MGRGGSPGHTEQVPARDELHRIGIAAGLDVAAVALFVVIGRRSHDEGSRIAGVLATAAPFLIGLAAAWLATRAWRWPMAILTGLVIWPVTLLVGMVARNLLFDRSTAVSFVIVATSFLGACLVGWRTVARRVSRRRQSSTATAGTS